MKRINKALSLMLTAALSCAVLAGQASAASGDALWADVDETSGEVVAVIETNAVVTDGVIDVTFDADKLPLYVALVAVCVAVLAGFGIYAKRRAAK